MAWNISLLGKESYFLTDLVTALVAHLVTRFRHQNHWFIIKKIFSVTYTLCSKKYGVLQSSSWAKNTLDAIYELDIDCPSASSSIGDPTNEGKTLEIIHDDLNTDIYEIFIDDDPVDDSMSQFFKLILPFDWLTSFRFCKSAIWWTFNWKPF